MANPKSGLTQKLANLSRERKLDSQGPFLNKDVSFKDRLMQLKNTKKQKKAAVIYIRVDKDIKDLLTARLVTDNLKYKDIFLAAISEYLNINIDDRS